MKKNVVGVFASSYEALKTIDSMRQDGIDNEHIFVVAKDPLKSNTLEEKTGVEVKSDPAAAEEPDNFWEQLKSYFTGDTPRNGKYSDYLLDLGMTDADVNKYVNAVEEGNILILVDSEHDHGRTGTLSTENMNKGDNTVNIKFHGEKVDNFTTGDRFGREEQNRLNEGRNQEHSTGSSQPGRPKEHPYGSVSAYRKKEYEEEMNPFENRYSSGRSIQTGTSDQPDYGNTPRG